MEYQEESLKTFSIIKTKCMVFDMIIEYKSKCKKFVSL